MADSEPATVGPTSQQPKAPGAARAELVKVDTLGTRRDSRLGPYRRPKLPPASDPFLQLLSPERLANAGIDQRTTKLRRTFKPTQKPEDKCPLAPNSGQRKEAGNATLAVPSKDEEPNNILACPFLKFDPSSHSGCSSRRLTTISSVKEHLRRRHFHPFSCSRCWEVFEDQDGETKHIRDCDKFPKMFSEPPFVNRDKMERMNVESRHPVPAGRWYELYDILFPGQPPPTSPYLENTLVLELADIRQFCMSSGPQIVCDVLRQFDAAGDGVSLASLHTDNTSAILCAAVDRVFDHWEKEQRSGESTLESCSDPVRSRAGCPPPAMRSPPNPSDLLGVGARWPSNPPERFGKKTSLT